MTDIKIIQNNVKDWVDKKGFKWSTYAEYCHLVEEIGELGEAIVVGQGERKAGSGSKGLADHSDISEEIGDSLFSLIVLANRYNIDLEECMKKTIRRYDEKIRKRELG